MTRRTTSPEPSAPPRRHTAPHTDPHSIDHDPGLAEGAAPDAPNKTPTQPADPPRQRSPRCGARTRRGAPCQGPAVRGKRRCRMHGGAQGSGAPRGNHNALKHGRYTAEAIAKRRKLRAMMRDSARVLREMLRETIRESREMAGVE